VGFGGLDGVGGEVNGVAVANNRSAGARGVCRHVRSNYAAWSRDRGGV
jgi:hypothetical protein